LGLAIVKKIMEDHHGELMLSDREKGGARVQLVFAAEAGVVARSDVPAAGRPELSAVSHGA
jgi:two-component system nitrogen regulation sensor histidine kinase NtrY